MALGQGGRDEGVAGNPCGWMSSRSTGCPGCLGLTVSAARGPCEGVCKLQVNSNSKVCLVTNYHQVATEYYEEKSQDSWCPTGHTEELTEEQEKMSCSEESLSF